MGRARVPRDGDALRLVVGEQLEEHVREPEQRVRREAVARRELLGEREEGPVREVVAVDEEELGVPRGAVVELQLLAGERLGHGVKLSCSRRWHASRFAHFPPSSSPPPAELLAARHRAHRAAEPLLPERYEDAAAAQAEVEALLALEDSSGAVALRDGRVVGYLLGAPRPNPIWGEHVWVELAGHAVEEPEDLRDLYAAAAGRWVDEGHVRHYALVPASDPAARRRLVARRLRPAARARDPGGARDGLAGGRAPRRGARCRRARRADPAAAAPSVARPIFAGGLPAEDPDELRAEILEDLAKPEIGDLVVERDGRIVGAFELVPVELSSVHAGLARPDGAALLGWAATHPDVRGSGTGVALTEGAFAWARERGHDVIVTDWRVTNLLSSRFWPARGFRETFLRLYRHIP